MSNGNPVIHQATRLKIMASLNALPSNAAIEFTRLKMIVETTDGNLGAHLEALEKAGYVATEKRFVNRKPQTRAAITSSGKRAFAEHIAYLREIIEIGNVK